MGISGVVNYSCHKTVTYFALKACYIHRMQSHRKQHLYKRARTIVFDLDNTLYPHDAILGHADRAYIDTARNLGCRLEEEEILRIGYAALAKGNAFSAAGALGVDEKALHEGMHERWPASLIPESSALVEPFAKLKNLGIETLLYSDGYSSRAKEAIDRLSLADYLPKHRILTRDGLASFHDKTGKITDKTGDFDEGHRRLRARSASNYRDMIFVDDNPLVLRRAKELGMITVQIGRPKVGGGQPYEPDFRYDDVKTFIDDFLKVRSEPTIINGPRQNKQARTTCIS